jgi:hypothetical protein
VWFAPVAATSALLMALVAYLLWPSAKDFAQSWRRTHG